MIWKRIMLKKLILYMSREDGIHIFLIKSFYIHLKALSSYQLYVAGSITVYFALSLAYSLQQLLTFKSVYLPQSLGSSSPFYTNSSPFPNLSSPF